jgi:hypothetical protein
MTEAPPVHLFIAQSAPGASLRSVASACGLPEAGFLTPLESAFLLGAGSFSGKVEAKVVAGEGECGMRGAIAFGFEGSCSAADKTWAGAEETSSGVDTVFPVTDKTLSASAKTFSKPDATLSDPDKTFSVSQKDFCVTGKTFSVADKTFGVTDTTFSMADKTLSVADKTFSATDKVMPIEQKTAVSCENRRFPAENCLFEHFQPTPTKTWLLHSPLGTGRTPRAIHCAGTPRA